MLSIIRIARSYLDFYRDTRGLTTVEYAVAGGLIALAVIVAFVTLGGTVGDTVNNIETNISNPP